MVAIGIGVRLENEAGRGLKALEADLDQVADAADDLDGGLDGVKKAAGRLSKALLASGIGALTAAAGALVSFTQATFESNAELALAHERTGLSVEALSAMQFAAERAGIGTETVADAAHEMNLRLAEAASLGSGPAVDALDLIGVSLEDIQDLAPEEQFDLLSKAIAGIEDPADRAFAAAELFGGAGEELIPVFGDMEDGLAGVISEAESYNAVTSKDQVEATEAVRETIGNLLAQVKGLVAEGLTVAIQWFRQVADWMRTNPDFQNFLNNVLKPLATFIADVLVASLRLIWTVLRELVGFLVNVFTGDWRGAWENIKNLFTGVWQVILDFFDRHFKQRFMAIWDAIREGVRNVVNGIIGFYQGMVNAVVAGINAIINAWNRFSITTPSVEILGRTIVPAFTWDTPDIPTLAAPQIPRLQTGGYIERGGLAVLHSGERVLPAAQVSRGSDDETTVLLRRIVHALESGGAGGITVEGTLVTTDELVELVSGRTAAPVGALSPLV